MDKQLSYSLTDKLLKENNFYVLYNLEPKPPYTIKELRTLIKPNKISLLKTKVVRKFVENVTNEIYYIDEKDPLLLDKYISKKTEVLYKVGDSINTKKLTEFISAKSQIYLLVKSPINRIYNYIKQLKNK